MRTPPGAVAAALVLVAGLGLAGCTQKSATGSNTPVVSGPVSNPDQTSSASSTTASTPAPTSAPPSSTATSSAAAPSSRPPRPPTSSAHPPVPSPTGSAPMERGGCPTAALGIRAIRGSGAAGHQFAFIQFTNNSGTACTLTGYPGVQLLAGGQPLGAPAARSGKAVRTVSIAPGASVTAGITDDSSCNAALSDSVQVFPPNRTEKIVLKLALRGCALQVDPVAAN